MFEIFGECSLCQPHLASDSAGHPPWQWLLMIRPKIPKYGSVAGGAVWVESALNALWLEIVDMGSPSRGCDVYLKQEWVAWSHQCRPSTGKELCASKSQICHDGHGTEKDSQVWLATGLLARACHNVISHYITSNENCHIIPHAPKATSKKKTL